jgi:hypothetical protein
VGVAVGTAVGVAVGATVGLTVGAADGVAVGPLEGVALGPALAVGRALGVTLGAALAVGAALGFAVGADEGLADGGTAAGTETVWPQPFNRSAAAATAENTQKERIFITLNPSMGKPEPQTRSFLSFPTLPIPALRSFDERTNALQNGPAAGAHPRPL